MQFLGFEKTDTHRIYHFAGIRIKVKRKGGGMCPVPDRTFVERNLKENTKMKLYGWWDGYRRKRINEYFIDEIFSWYLLKEKFSYHILKRLNIPQVEFVLTTNCTLKCKDCSNFIPQMKNKYMMSFEEFKNDVDALSKASHEIKTTLLLGGEPLLNKDLPAMISYIAKNRKFKTIYIVTNGTILFNDKLIAAIKKYRKKVRVYISNYSLNEKLKDILKIDEIKQTLTANKIKYYINPYLRWRSMNPCKKLNLSENGIIDKFNNCCAKCVQIYKNQMHICPISTFCEVQGFVNFDVEGQEYAVLDSNLPKSKIKRDLVNFYSRNLFNPCDWCPEVNTLNVLPAEQIQN